MGKNYSQLILGIIIGIVVGVLLFMLVNKGNVLTSPSSQIVTMELHSENNEVDSVFYNGAQYEVFLVSASDTAATIRAGKYDSFNQETKEISEGQTGNIGGLTIKVAQADETNFFMSANLEVSACGNLRSR